MGTIGTKIRKHSLYQGQLKNIDTEVKAYFLGFMYADGCISNFKNSPLASKHLIKISIEYSDGYILDRIKEELPFFRLGTFDYSVYNKACKIQKSITYASKFCFEDLKANGLIERKSYENKDKLFIPNIPKELLHHFIRGYFDGDGSISIAASRPNLRRVDLCSVSKTITEDVRNWFINEGCEPDVYRTKVHNDENRQNVFLIEWIRSDKILKLKDILYKDATIYLKRKKEKFDSFKIISRRTSLFTCPECGGESTKNGTREMEKGLAYRYKCVDCKFGFTKYELAPIKSGELSGNS
jgi:predicted RNA-binding Zn-ribbon protein involved in translation (DUF1610 family)